MRLATFRHRSIANLAACYRPGRVVSCEMKTPIHFFLPFQRIQPFSSVVHYGLYAGSVTFGIFATSRLPSSGYQGDLLLTLWIPHFRALLLCPIRSLFRMVCSPSSMGGFIEASCLRETAPIGDFVSHGLVNTNPPNFW